MTEPAPPTRSIDPARPDIRMLLDMMKAAGGPDSSTLAPAEARAAMLGLVALAEANPRPLATVTDLSCPGPAGTIPLRLYDSRETRGPGPVVVYFHGGGFVISDLETHHSKCTEIAAELDLPVIAVDYRLAPEHPFPAAPDDCEAAARWIAASPAELGGRSVTGLITMGDSAGGNLAIVVTQALTASPAEVPVIVNAPMFPVVDEDLTSGSMTEFAADHLLTRATMEWFMGHYAAEPGSARAFPLHANHTGTPPTVVLTAGLDPLRDHGRRYATALVAAGVTVTYMEAAGTVHIFTQLRKVAPSGVADLRAYLSAVRLHANLAEATA